MSSYSVRNGATSFGRRRARIRALPSAALVCLFLIIAFANVAVSSVAWSGNESEQGQDPIPIRAGARLVWDQPANSIDEMRSLTFRLYVDNAQSALTDVRCADIRTAVEFVCSGVLPTMSAGRHVLALASVQDGVETVPSAAIVVEFSGSAQVTAALSGAVAPSSSSAGLVCSGAPVECYESALIASGLEPVTALSAAPDGRIFFVEGERSVRVIVGNAIVPEAALALDQTDSRVVGLAIDTSFASTQTVFVAWTDSLAGSPRLNITRYREVQNTLGEGATIVTGLPFRSGALGPLAVDATGQLYVALPSVVQSESGVVARFTRDGFVPRENPASSPALAEGPASPTGIGIDPRRGNVWLVGQSPEGREAMISFAPSTGRLWPIRLIPAIEGRRQGSDPGFLIGVSNRLLRAVSTPYGAPEVVEEVRAAPGFELLAAAEAPNGSVYVSVVDTESDRSTSSILLLTRRQ